MDLVDTLREVRYWSEVLCCTIMVSKTETTLNGDVSSFISAIMLSACFEILSRSTVANFVSSSKEIIAGFSCPLDKQQE